MGVGQGLAHFIAVRLVTSRCALRLQFAIHFLYSLSRKLIREEKEHLPAKRFSIHIRYDRLSATAVLCSTTSLKATSVSKAKHCFIGYCIFAPVNRNARILPPRGKIVGAFTQSTNSNGGKSEVLRYFVSKVFTLLVTPSLEPSAWWSQPCSSR